VSEASTSAASWQAGLRPWLVRELLRPTTLARDVEAGWIGDLLGRSAWPELRLPLLAAWTAQWSADADDDAPELPVVHARPLPQQTQGDAPTQLGPVQAHATIKPSAPAEAAAAPPPRAALRPLRDPVSTPPLAHAPAAVLASASSPASSPAPSTASPAPTLAPRPRVPASSELATSVHAEAPPARAATDDPQRERPASAALPRVVAAFQRERLERRGRAPEATGPRPAPPQDRTPPATTTTTTTATQRTDPPGLPRAPAQAPIDAPPPPTVHNDLAHTPGLSGHVARDSSPTPSPPGPARAELPRVTGEPATGPGRLASAPPREPAAPAELPVAEARRPGAAPPRATPPRPPTDLSQSAAPPTAPPRAVLRPAEPAPPVRARGLPGERAPLAIPAAWSGDPPAPTRPGPPRTELPHSHAAATRPDEPRPAPPTLASSPVRTDIQPASPTAAPAQAPAPALDIEALIDTVQRRLARELGRARELRRAIR